MNNIYSQCGDFSKNTDILVISSNKKNGFNETTLSSFLNSNRISDSSKVREVILYFPKKTNFLLYNYYSEHNQLIHIKSSFNNSNNTYNLDFDIPKDDGIKIHNISKSKKLYSIKKQFYGEFIIYIFDEGLLLVKLQNKIDYKYDKKYIIKNNENKWTIFQIVKYYYGLVSIQGKRPYMEDTYSLTHQLCGNKASMFCIMDGHGGNLATTYCHKHLQHFISQNLPQQYDIKKIFKVIINAYDDVHNKFIMNYNGQRSGTTVILSLLWKLSNNKTKLITSNLGDSLSKLYSFSSSKNSNLINLTHEHKPCNETSDRLEEINDVVGDNCRIESNGTSLAVSRAIGDQNVMEYLSRKPHLNEHNLTSDDKLLLLGTDGFWDTMPDKTIINVLDNFYKRKKDSTIELTNKLVQMAFDNGSGDNITLLIIKIHQ